MKKLLPLILALTLAFALFACDKKSTAPATAAEWLDLGQKYLLDLDFEQAIVAFDNVIRIEPKNVKAYIGLADAYVGLGETDKAIAALQEGIANADNKLRLENKLAEIEGGIAEPQTSPPEPDASSAPSPTPSPLPTPTPTPNPIAVFDSVIAQNGEFHSNYDAEDGFEYYNYYGETFVGGLAHFEGFEYTIKNYGSPLDMSEAGYSLIITDDGTANWHAESFNVPIDAVYYAGGVVIGSEVTFAAEESAVDAGTLDVKVSGFFTVETHSTANGVYLVTVGIVLSKAQALEFLDTGAISDYPGFDFSGLSEVISKK
ncbi:MAG: tetratricopeptide repeat protein [Oscillospiraceae bacterium]|jgi:tetratricopeptide (TPR) repeat protein|nr:tetratricopeptide repeat protein [Oscillospiraceae bacterium]